MPQTTSDTPVDRPKELRTGRNGAHAHQTHTPTCATTAPSLNIPIVLSPIAASSRGVSSPPAHRANAPIPTVYAKQLDDLREHAEGVKDSASVSGASSLSLGSAPIATALICGGRHILCWTTGLAASGADVPAYMYARSRRRASRASAVHISGEENA